MAELTDTELDGGNEKPRGNDAGESQRKPARIAFLLDRYFPNVDQPRYR